MRFKNESDLNVIHAIIFFHLKTLVQENWQSLVAEHEKDVLEWSACINKDVLVLCYLHDVKVKNKHKKHGS